MYSANYAGLVKAAKKQDVELLDMDELADKMSDKEFEELFGVSKPPSTLGRVGLTLGTLAGAAAGGVGGYMSFKDVDPNLARLGALGGSLGGTLLTNWLERKLTGGHDSGWLFIGG